MKNRNLVKDIKILRNNQKSLKEFAKEKFLDENGNAVIDVFVTKEKLFNDLSNPDEPEINPAIFDYINYKANYVPIEYPLIVKLHTKDEIDNEYVQNKILEHYKAESIQKLDDLKRNKIVSTLLFTIGLIFMALYLTFELIPSIDVLFNEIFGVIASFVIWESADYAIINRSALKVQFLAIAHLTLLSVVVER